MVKQIHLRLLPNPTEGAEPLAYWLTMQDGRIASKIKQGDLSAAAIDIGPDNVIAYIPGIDILLTRVNLPAGRKSQLRHALPYALEENLIDDVDDLHCALGPQIDNGKYVAAVTRHEKISYWHQLLLSTGLHIQALLPDFLLVPYTVHNWSVACEGNNAYVRTTETEGFVCQTNVLPLLLQKELEAVKSPAPERIMFYGCLPFNDSIMGDAISSQCQLVQHPTIGTGNLIELLANNPLTTTNLNLLQGEYAPSSRILQRLRPWYTAAVLAGVLILLGFVGAIIEYVSLQQQSAKLDQQIVQVFSQTFPDAKNVRPETVSSIMKNRLTQLRSTGRGNGPDFSQMLAKVAPVVTKSKGVNAQQLRYQMGQMEIMLETPDLQSLEDLKNRLSEAVPWDVELKSANSTENKVQGRIVIFEKS
jgi:general secretion pathway protein L